MLEAPARTGKLPIRPIGSGPWASRRAWPLIAVTMLVLLSLALWPATQGSPIALLPDEIAPQVQALSTVLYEAWLAVGFPCH